MQITGSLIAGILFGSINWFLWHRWSKTFLFSSQPRAVQFMARLFIKMAIMAPILYFGIKENVLSPIGFLIGFSIVLVAMMIKGFK